MSLSLPGNLAMFHVLQWQLNCWHHMIYYSIFKLNIAIMVSLILSTRPAKGTKLKEYENQQYDSLEHVLIALVLNNCLMTRIFISVLDYSSTTKRRVCLNSSSIKTKPCWICTIIDKGTDAQTQSQTLTKFYSTSIKNQVSYIRLQKGNMVESMVE